MKGGEGGSEYDPNCRAHAEYESHLVFFPKAASGISTMVSSRNHDLGYLTCVIYKNFGFFTKRYIKNKKINE